MTSKRMVSRVIPFALLTSARIPGFVVSHTMNCLLRELQVEDLNIHRTFVRLFGDFGIEITVAVDFD